MDPFMQRGKQVHYDVSTRASKRRTVDSGRFQRDLTPPHLALKRVFKVSNEAAVFLL